MQGAPQNDYSIQWINGFAPPFDINFAGHYGVGCYTYFHCDTEELHLILILRLGMVLGYVQAVLGN